MAIKRTDPRGKQNIISPKALLYSREYDFVINSLDKNRDRSAHKSRQFIKSQSGEGIACAKFLITPDLK